MIFADEGPESNTPRLTSSSDRKIGFVEKVVVERKLPNLDTKNSESNALKGKSANIQRVLTFPEEVSQSHQQQTLLIIDTVNDQKKGRNSPPRPPIFSTPSRVTSARPKARFATPAAPSSSAATGATVSGNNHNSNAISHSNTHHSKQASLENRILIRLAGILPSEDDRGGPPAVDGEPPHQDHHTAHNINFEKLSESRYTLLNLNQELDEIMYDVRSWGMEIDRFSFGIAMPASAGPPLVTIPNNNNDSNGNPQDNSNAIVFDQVIADLSQQAGKKVNRIKNSYRKHYHKVKQQHETETSELRIQVEQLSSRLYQLEMEGKLTAPLKSTELNRQQDGAAAETVKIEIDDEHSRAIKYHEKLLRSMRLEQEDMQQVLLDRLEHERKVALDKVAQLTQQLQLSQQELAASNERAQHMAKQLVAKDTTLFDRERLAVNSLKDTLKAILYAQQKQKSISLSLSDSAQERTTNLINSITGSLDS